MNLFERKLLVPVDVMITIAINIVVVVLGYYLVMAWGLLVPHHSDFDGLGLAVRLAQAGNLDRRGPRCCEAPLAGV